MQSASTETFSVHFPSVYDHILTLRETIIGEHRKDDKCVSYVNICLEELSIYDYYEGEDLLTRFQESCLEERGTVEVIADKTLPVAGHLSNIRTARSPDGNFYYFGLIRIDNEYGYKFIGDCAWDAREYYEPLFDEIWQSVHALSDAERAPKRSGTEYIRPDNKDIVPFTVPADDQSFWQIGGHQFTLSQEMQCYISDGDGALFIRIDAQAPDYIDLEQSDIINDYEDRKVYLQFSFKGIYHAGIPSGKFRLENENDVTSGSYLWKGGFHYSQQLTADVTLEAGWLGINGYFNHYPVKLGVKLPVENLAWEHYRFLSVPEISTAAKDAVRQLSLKDPHPGILEETIQPLSRLQVLSIYFRDNNQAAVFKTIPEAVKHLKELRELSLIGVSALDNLPQWLGHLKKLETILLSDSKVTTIHPEIFQLPVLKKLYLSDNQLQSIPSTLSDSLETLLVANNQLTSVPASVLRLHTLNIENNPLQQLPAGLENIPLLSLELEKKMTMLDYAYKGVDGLGTVQYDDDRFHARYDPELLLLLEEQITAAGLDRFKEGLMNRSRKSLAFETTEKDAYSEKGNHRFGGLPDLPRGMNYPTFIAPYQQKKGLQFIAQINCTAIAHLQDYLPRTGILYFFIEDQEDVVPKVLYYEGDTSHLQSAKDLDIEEDFIYDNNGIYTPFRAETGKYAGIPPMYNTHRLYPELEDMDDMDDEAERLRNSLNASSVAPVHSMNSYVFKQHGTPEMEAVNARKGKPEEWMVLLRVGSDNKPGFSFWDAGEIYFMIHKSDLEKKDFSNVYCGLESS